MESTVGLLGLMLKIGVRPEDSKMCEKGQAVNDLGFLSSIERVGNIRPPDLPLEKPVCRSGSNS